MSNITFNGETAVHAKSEGILTTSDVCMTPPFCIPISYTNIAESKMADMCATSVKIQGSPACNQKSNFKISKGDAPGACGGTSSGSVGQMAEFLEGSQDIKIEGKPAVRNNDQMVSNLKNTAPQPLVQPPAGKAPVGKAEATEAEKAFSQKINLSGMVGRDADTGELLGRLPYQAYTEKGEMISDASGVLSKEGLTQPIFTAQAEKIKIVLGDGAWRKYGDVLHEDDAGQSTDLSGKLNMRFFALDGETIEGLECRVCIDGTTNTYTTDDQGMLPVITTAPNSKFELSVKKFDGSFKVIDKATCDTGNRIWEYVSPKIVVETETEKHKGEAGSAETKAPQPAAKDRGDKAPAPKKTKSIPQHISGNEPVKTKDALKPGRDAKGNPLTTFETKVMDWWGSWRMPSMNLWGVSKSFAASMANKPATGSTEVELARVKQLIDFLEEQADYEYKKSEGSVAILAAFASSKFKHKHGEKRPEKSNDHCYKYVKVALVRAQWVEKALEGEPASGAAQELRKHGFREVTDELPDSRWAAPGDISVYAWTAAVLAKKHHDSGNPHHKNYGHIDVRSYDNYLTDYIPEHHRPRWFRYETPKIYRLFHDPLPIVRMKAFLSCIREYECQAVKNLDERYTLLNCALPGTNSKQFTSFDTHPWEKVPEEKRGSATASGAYQILYSTWHALLTGAAKNGVNLDRKMFSLGPHDKKFTPEMQDRMAVALIELREALGHVRKGEIEEAVGKLKDEWSSLPGGTENTDRRAADKRPMNLAYFKELFDTNLAVEKEKAGIK